ncbi:MAG: hypothetical protein FI707_13325 [SAR202 cluster bacterium]|nr:hypothetical protein [SAR202 cluster bacterium]MDP6664310.1 hypothetical protein [SAR202 cluster bacterium]MQG69759.1 hypothetical protein [SAR202 cluster bacterium]
MTSDHRESIMQANSPDEPILRDKFRRLAKTWRDETGMYSVDVKKIAHPAYREIIELGDQAIPLILADLEQHGGHWHHALEAILGYSPIKGDAKINLRELKERWLAWGREKGYLSQSM